MNIVDIVKNLPLHRFIFVMKINYSHLMDIRN